MILLLKWYDTAVVVVVEIAPTFFLSDNRTQRRTSGHPALPTVVEWNVMVKERSP